MREPATAYVGLGSNMDGPAAQISRAFEELAALPDTRLIARSPLYKSPPMGPQGQPDFVNAAAALSTALVPQTLMQALLGIEQRHGRRRDGTRWGPRSLDLDLLLYDELVMHEPGLTLPHPGLHERAFVLYPLADIAPQQQVPGFGTVEALRARHPDAHLRRLESAAP
ncbi:MAG TPA: 2-amino-4-hydroxy-6-hydroxymethyldihydropteridine diphosphokinase [Gammaproteobacteria bacterium]|nr:2-amino-4-hydroxy-6-hydroxymethyldihydropteridine diphosphokinase [Gammaproteobacteria bacterium]